MYSYIYDTFIGQGKYEGLLYKIEKQLTDLGLNGKIIRLSASKNARVAVEDEIRQGTNTIIAVGDDSTVAQIVNAIAANQSENKHLVTLGIIPIGNKNNRLAAAFGIKSINQACEIILARHLQEFNLAQINQGYFLFKTILSAPDTILEIDKNYIIQNLKPVIVEISNNPIQTEEALAKKRLTLKISSREGESLFFIQELLMVNKQAIATTDDCLKIKTPARIKTSAEKIKVIVGRERII
jgi:hypothetical protein